LTGAGGDNRQLEELFPPLFFSAVPPDAAGAFCLFFPSFFSMKIYEASWTGLQLFFPDTKDFFEILLQPSFLPLLERVIDSKRRAQALPL